MIHHSGQRLRGPAMYFLVTILLISALVGCGGGGSKASSTPTPTPTPTPAPTVAISITPTTKSVSINGTATFTASVTGATDTSVRWAVVETGGGAVDSTGTYTAPNLAGTYHIKATSNADATKSSQAAIAVSAPAPQFTTAPSAVGLEGAPYAYSVETTDSAGGTVSYSLTTAPTGATVSGSEVDWTPTADQSRKPNTFTLTATTSEGGSATQTWTVTPNGTIRGSWIDTYWHAQGQTPVPYDDLSNTDNYSFSAMVVDPADGSYTTIAGTGNSDGTFTIENVPPGYYWLNINRNGYGENYWTDSSTFDRGTDYTGRQQTYTSCNTTLNVSLSGLDIYGYDLYASIPNQSNSFYVSGNQNGSAYTGNWQMCGSIDPTLGDDTYIFQSEYPQLSESFDIDAGVTGPALHLSTLAVAEGDTVDVSGNLTNNPQSVDVKFRGADWTASFANVAPSPTTFEETVAIEFLQPFVSDRVTSPIFSEDQAVQSLWYVWANPESWNLDIGTIQYNNPYPSSWLPVYAGYAYANIQNDMWWIPWNVENAYLTTTPPANGTAPLMSAVQNPMINGASLFTAGASSSASSITLSWTAPTGLRAYGYEIYYYNSDGSCGYTSGVVYTASTTVTLPPGLLSAGCTYLFNISAMADSRANIGSSPWHGGYPQAYANIVSAPVLINSDGDTPNFIHGRAAVARIAQKNVVHTKYGDFLVVKNRKTPLNAKARMMGRFNQHHVMNASKTSTVVK
jgi:hypothetical protein